MTTGFLKTSGLTEKDYYRLLQWSVLPKEGFSLNEIEWLESCLEIKADCPPEELQCSSIQRGLLQPVIIEGEDVFPPRFKLGGCHD
jgi:hypothetical protein